MEPISQRVVAKFLGRDASLFGFDYEANAQELAETVRGQRILVCGAGGSIGGAFVRQLVSLQPAGVDLVDLSENGLVEVVRDLRSAGAGEGVTLRTFSVGIGSSEFRHLLESSGGYDTVANFAALKHVRAERDVHTLMRMIHVNVLSVADLLGDLSHSNCRRFFSVSSDKAVRPASLMGASKAFMERVMETHSESVPASSARFANVAFSSGSLPCGFEHRLAKGQPLAGPSDVRRYFISAKEAAQICLLSCFLGDNRDIFVPHLAPDKDLKSFKELAELLLAEHGLRPRFCESAEEARALMLERSTGEWPCHFAPSNTSGEKPFEEFFAPDEKVDRERFQGIGVVRRPRTGKADMETVLAVVHDLNAMRSSGAWCKGAIMQIVRRVVPSLEHIDTGMDLDARM